MAMINIPKPSASVMANTLRPTNSMTNIAKSQATGLWSVISLPWQELTPWLTSETGMTNTNKPS